MSVELTRDAQKTLAMIYKVYLERRKSGVSKRDAKCFNSEALRQQYFQDEHPSDFSDSVREVCRAFGCRVYIDGSFMLSDSFIIHMENRFKNGILDVATFLAQFIP